MTPDHDNLMALALDEARKGEAEGNRPIGAIIVKDGEVVGRGRNTVRVTTNPINHAETVAIMDASRRLNTTDLSGATLYSTMEPCPMCLWAIRVANIERLVLGARHADFQRTDLGDYTVERMLDLTRQSMDFVTGVRAAECIRIRRDWFARHGG